MANKVKLAGTVYDLVVQRDCGEWIVADGEDGTRYGTAETEAKAWELLESIEKRLIRSGGEMIDRVTPRPAIPAPADVARLTLADAAKACPELGTLITTARAIAGRIHLSEPDDGDPRPSGFSVGAVQARSFRQDATAFLAALERCGEVGA